MRLRTRGADDLRLKPPDRRPKGSKYKNVVCEDEQGNRYHSKAERAVVMQLREAAKRGDCSEPERGVYAFEHGGVLIGRYTSDAEIDVCKTFSIVTKGGVYRFEAGKHYTIDVKSEATKTTASQLRFKLMQAFFGIVVFEVLMRSPPAKSVKGQK